MTKLFCTPLGNIPHNLFYKDLEQSRSGESILVLPSRLLADRVCRRGSVECISIEGLAMRLLNMNGYGFLREISRGSQELLVEELLEELAEAGRMKYFQQLAGKKGYIKAMTSLLGQLSRSGTDARQLSLALGNWQERNEAERSKDFDVALLYTLYQNRLKEKNLFDIEGKYRLAIRILAGSDVVLPWRKIYFSDFYTFDRLQLDFIKELSGKCEVSLGMMYEKKRRALAGASGDVINNLSGFCDMMFVAAEHEIPYGEDCEDLKYLASVWGWAGRNRDDSSAEIEKNTRVKKLIRARHDVKKCPKNIELHCAGSREGEISMVMTKVKELLLAGVKPSQIMLAVRNLRNYGGLKNFAVEYGIPVTLSSTAALAIQPLTTLLLDMLLSTVNNRNGAEAYFRVINAPLGKALYGEDLSWSTLLRGNKYFLTPDSVRGSMMEQMEKRDGEGSKGTFFYYVDALLQSIPAEATVSFYLDTLQKVVDSLELEKLLGEQFKARKIDLLALKLVLRSREELENVLTMLRREYEICGQQGKKISGTDFCRLLQERVADVQINLDKGQQNGVLITDVVDAQCLEYEYIFILGVREGEFPAVESENWIYGDAERRFMKYAMGIDVELTEDHLAADEYFFANLLTQAREKIFISWFEEDKVGASVYIGRLQNIMPQLIVSDFNRNEKKPCSPEEATRCGVTDDWLREKMGADVEGTLAAASIELKRSSGEITDGSIKNRQLLAHIKEGTAEKFSASKLEMFAQCPFKYLVTQIWQQEKYMEAQEELEPTVRGTVVHATLERLFSAKSPIKGNITNYNYPEVKEILRNIFEECCEENVREEVRNSVFWNYDKEMTWKLLLNWLDYEYKERSLWREYSPWKTEYAFGFRKENSVELAAEDGSTFNINGKIDRLDRCGDKIFITDYKTGGYPNKNALEQGLDLQLPVYMLAAAQLDGSVAGGGYLSLKAKERINTVAFTDLGSHEFKLAKLPFEDDSDKWESMKNFSEALLKKYVAAIWRGEFQPAPVDCRYCQAADVCRYQDKLGEGDE